MSRSTMGADPAPLVALLRGRPRGVSVAALRDAALDLGDTSLVWEKFAGQASLLGDPEPVARARQEISDWGARGVATRSILDEEYPDRVRSVIESPPVLFSRGRVVDDDRGVSVVGSREVSDEGRAMAADVATALVAEGYTVVSGLAKGVDTAAHTSTLDAGGRAVAFVATGLDHVYPAENRGLHQRIIDAGGAVFSQYLPEATARKHTFLQRNALMSGYGIATVVIEAGEHSGARAQARMAVEHGRPVILGDRVVGSTQWAKALVDHPQVAMARTPSEVMGLLTVLTERRRDVDDALRVLLRS